MRQYGHYSISSSGKKVKDRMSVLISVRSENGEHYETN